MLIYLHFKSSLRYIILTLLATANYKYAVTDTKAKCAVSIIQLLFREVLE